MTKDPIPEVERILAPRRQPSAAEPSGIHLTRRSFLRYAGFGTTGAALLISGAADLFGDNLLMNGKVAAKTSPADTGPRDGEMGEVTLDGLMMTYFSMPSQASSSVFTFGKNFSTTFTLKLPQTPGIVMTGMVTSGSPSLDASHSQHASSWVKDAVSLRSASEGRASGRKEQFSKLESSEPLQIYGLRNPKLRFSGNPDRLQFCFGDMGQRSFNLGREVGAQTFASMYSQYITDPALLFPPRFYWLDVAGADGETAFDFVLPSKLMARNGITATVTVKIVDQTGFRSGVLREAFAPGNDVEITYHSAQEFYSKNLMELQTTPSASDTRIYIDRVFKTFVMTGLPGRT
jgi:hypothetical protein